MSKLTNLRVSSIEVVEGLLDLFVYAEQKWCNWDKLEEKIAEVDYEKLSDEHLDWFIEFLVNCCFRVWGSEDEEIPHNIVREKDRVFHIYNYDWKSFIFFKRKAGEYEMNSHLLVIAKDNLTESEIKWLRSKCK